MVAQPKSVLDVRPDLNGLLEAQLCDITDAVDGGVTPVGDLERVPPLTLPASVTLVLLAAAGLLTAAGRTGRSTGGLVVQQLQFVVVGPHAAIDATADDKDARSVD